MAFEGYTQETLDFLWGIRFNNERGWFMAHKEDYQEHLLRPTRALGEQVYEALHEKYPKEPFMLKMSRIYRDARRLHGQGPYKDHLWFCIRTGDEDWTGRPTFYFEIAPDYYSYGMGFWSPKASLMEAYRKGIDEKPEELAKLVRRFNRQTHFVLAGPEYFVHFKRNSNIHSNRSPLFWLTLFQKFANIYVNITYCLLKINIVVGGGILI